MDGVTVLCVAGELDHHTGPLLDRALGETAFSPGTGVILDVSGLEYCDSTGLTLIIKALHRAQAAGCAFSLAGPGNDLLRVLNITGLDGFLTVHADSAQAVDALRR
jgi:anti-sigma B factor antagonist